MSFLDMLRSLRFWRSTLAPVDAMIAGVNFIFEDVCWLCVRLLFVEYRGSSGEEKIRRAWWIRLFEYGWGYKGRAMDKGTKRTWLECCAERGSRKKEKRVYIPSRTSHAFQNLAVTLAEGRIWHKLGRSSKNARAYYGEQVKGSKTPQRLLEVDRYSMGEQFVNINVLFFFLLHFFGL